jgi:hypoxanthine phosphoribosyltransferase
MYFLRAKSYDGVHTTGHVQIETHPEWDLAGRHVIICEDIVDTGTTMQAILPYIASYGPASTVICTLLLKPDVFDNAFPVHYTGFRIGPEFVVGYGLDFNDLGRTLPAIYRLKDNH